MHTFPVPSLHVALLLLLPSYYKHHCERSMYTARSRYVVRILVYDVILCMYYIFNNYAIISGSY